MAAGAASATRVSHLPESLPLPLVRFLLAQPQSLSENLRLLAVDRGMSPGTMFALGRSEGRTVILCLVNGEAGEDQLREARWRAAAAVDVNERAAPAAARPRIVALAGRFAETWQHPADCAEHQVPELWLWSNALPTDPEPVRLSRFTPPATTPEKTDGEDDSCAASSDLESPDPWVVPPGASRLSPDEIASLLDPPTVGDAPGSAGT